jgi:serine/threonine protein kinase
VLSRAVSEALAGHKKAGWFYSPAEGLRRVRTLSGEIETWVGERASGEFEVVRIGSGEPALELILNELRVLSAVSDPGLTSVAWTARTGSSGLSVGLRWREAAPLVYPLDLRWLLRSFIALSKAVGALHRAGWIHADLKPESVSWGEDPSQLLVWDLRMAQAPGPRAVAAVSARFASPEQVAGSELGFTADVYALGVMLYSMFIRDRFPAILLPKGGPAAAAVGPRQAALSAITSIGAFDDDGSEAFQGAMNDTGFLAPPQRNVQRPASPAPRTDHQAILGAKILFAIELERVLTRTADIGVAKELLGVIERATAQKPGERFADADAFAEELAKLLGFAEELAG